MYNQELKEAFIDERTSDVTVDQYFLPNLFKKTEPFEEKLGKDVCNFTTREIENMYKTLDYTSYDSLVVANSTLTTYTTWGLNEGVVNDSQNHFLEFDRDRLFSLVNVAIRQAKIVNRETILSWCSELPNAADAFILLGLFEGISGKSYCEFWSARGEDIDISSKTIKLFGRETPLSISIELCQIGLDAAEECVYRSPVSDNMRKFDLEPSTKIIKDFPNVREDMGEFAYGRRIYNRIRRILAFLGVDKLFIPGNIAEAGIIDMILRESAKKNISPTEYLDGHIDDISQRFAGKRLNKKDMLRKYGQYLER